jgi:hypothetical protein
MRKSTFIAPLLFAASAIPCGACGSNEPAAAADAGSSQDAAPNSSYPAGPYGYTNGATIENYHWMGWTDPKGVNYTGDLEEIQLADYYDPDGTKNIKAIFVNASARWCSVCKIEQDDIRARKAQWAPKGVVFIESIFENVNYEPAGPEDIAAWGIAYNVDWILVVDPGNKLSSFFDTTATPMNMFIDARTMQIKDIVTGMPDDSWWTTHLETLTK